MPNSITNWFRRRRRAAKNDRPVPSSTVIPPIPKLPSDRPGRLTPTPSCEDLIVSTSTAGQDSSFFTKLPFEIRRQILIEAFGGRTVHMDLTYAYPPVPRGNPPSEEELRWGRVNHCNMNTPQEMHWHGEDGAVIVDESQPKEWRWGSSVCHRNPPRVLTPADYIQPAEDRCRFGITHRGRVCASWPGEFPDKCFIGVMGWLCSCRQAYIEGIDVLYATNTIHTASKALLMSINEAILPKRLSSITSVELLWNFEPFPNARVTRSNPPLSDFASFHAFLKTVPVMFPKTKRLYISLEGNLIPASVVDGVIQFDQSAIVVDETYLHPVDAMVQTLGSHVQDFSLAIPSSLYRGQRVRAVEAGDLVEQTCFGGKSERLWRSLSDCAHRSGYWLCMGQKNISRPIVCTMGTGPFEDTVPEEDRILYAY